MTCDKYEEQVSALIDNELNEEEAELLFRHLSACPSCRRSLRTVLDLRSDLKEEEPPLAPAGLDERMSRRFSFSKRMSADRKTVRSRLWTKRISMPVPLAAAILLFFIVGTLLLSPKSMDTQLRQPEGRVEAVYITTLPVVEVQGYFR